MKCNVCVNTGLKPVLSLPGYPLNSVYLSPEEVIKTERYAPRNFDLYVCEMCGHFQAESGVALSELYNDEYNYNTKNAGVQGRIAFFLDQLTELSGHHFNRVIDIGCYDLSLLKAVRKKISANYYIGIDPSIPAACLSNEEDILCFKEYVDNVDIPAFDKDIPDLIISDQTFEHIPAVNKTLANVMQKVSNNSVFAVCVPSMEVLIEKMNFHNLIHEHVNYFSLTTLAKLFNLNGATLKRYTLNYLSTCGFLFGLFTKDGAKTAARVMVPNAINEAYFSKHYRLFMSATKNTMQLLEAVQGETLYGFGASDITANLAYFLGTDFSFLENIFDDTGYKQGKFYPFLKPEIVPITKERDLSNASCLITSPQAARYIYTRLNEFKFKRILNPIGIVS